MSWNPPRPGGALGTSPPPRFGPHAGRRARFAAVVALVTVALGGPAGAASATTASTTAIAPIIAVGPLAVSTTRAARGSTVVVTAPGCADDFQVVEARLVVGRGVARRSAALASSAGPVVLTVPWWAPSGSASIEATCLDADGAGAGDGAAGVRFSYAPVPVRIPVRPLGVKTGMLALDRVVADGTLLVSGSGCPGPVRLAVARGPGLVGSEGRFHYGRTTVTPGPDGRWVAPLPLRYRVGEFTDPIAPGPMAVFASCGDVSYRPESFQVDGRSPRPAVTVLSWNPAGVYLAQCTPGNTLAVTVEATLGNGSVRTVGHEGPGHEYGERFQWLPLPEGVVAATYTAACTGRAGPSFSYAPASWPVPGAPPVASAP